MAEETRSAIDYLDLIRHGGRVRRFHTLDLLHHQNVAEHSFGVAGLCLVLTGGEASASLLKAALHHDVPECLLGDVPRNVKVDHPELAAAFHEAERKVVEHHGLDVQLNELEVQLLNEADLLEMMFFILEERERGSRRLDSAFYRGSLYMSSRKLSSIGEMLFQETTRRFDGRK